MTPLTPALSRALAACTQFRDAHGREPTPRELADLLPPVLDRRTRTIRSMRPESAQRFIERLNAAGYLSPQSVPLVGMLRECDELLRTIHCTNGDRERIQVLRERIAAVTGTTL